MRYFMFGPSNGSIKSLQRGTFLPEQTWKNRTFIPKAISFPSYFLYSPGSVFQQFTWIRAYSVPKQFLLLLEPVVKSQTFVTHPPATHHWSATMEMIIITQYLFYCKLNSDIFK